MFNTLGRWFWNVIERDLERQIGYSSRALAARSARDFNAAVDKLVDTVRWTVRQLSRDLYKTTRDYYKQLPPVRPSQYRQVHEMYKSGNQRWIEYENSRSPGGWSAENKPASPADSGEFVAETLVPGGAGQRSTPDWMLPLILGLYGALNPEWSQLQDEEMRALPKAKKICLQTCVSKSRPCPAAPHKRRPRGIRGSVRRRLNYPD